MFGIELELCEKLGSFLMQEKQISKCEAKKKKKNTLICGGSWSSSSPLFLSAWRPFCQAASSTSSSHSLHSGCGPWAADWTEKHRHFLFMLYHKTYRKDKDVREWQCFFFPKNNGMATTSARKTNILTCNKLKWTGLDWSGFSGSSCSRHSVRKGVHFSQTHHCA